MSAFHEDLVRLQVRERLVDAEARRLQRHARARRQLRRSEAAAQRVARANAWDL